MRAEANTLDFSIGEVLSIKYKDGKQKPVAYMSKSLNEAERNYEIHNKEMLAIIQCLEAQRHFLERVKDQFKIWMNHKNLEYVASTSTGRVNTLSRRADWAEGVKRDNKN